MLVYVCLCLSMSDYDCASRVYLTWLQGWKRFKHLDVLEKYRRKHSVDGNGRLVKETVARKGGGVGLGMQEGFDDR